MAEMNIGLSPPGAPEKKTEKHAKLSPSGAHRWLKCPGSVREESKYPRTSSDVAIDGTHSHTLLSACLMHGKDANEYLGQGLADQDGIFQVKLDRTERVQTALRYIRSRTHNAIYSEIQVNPKGAVASSEMNGTVDVIIADGQNGNIEIIDYKDGMMHVSAVDNPQLELYALGAMNSVEVEFGGVIKTVTMTIIQPKLAVKNQNVISSQTITIDELYEKTNVFNQAALVASVPDAPLIAGESQCMWCRHKGACSELISFSLATNGIKFGDTDVARQAAQKNPAELSDEQIAGIVEASPLLRQMIEAVNKEALRRFKAGQYIPGLKMVKGNGSRSWSLSDEDVEGRLRAMGIPKACVYSSKLISPAQAKKLKWLKKNGDSKSLSKRQLETMEANYITKKDGKLTIVPESDKRPSVITDASGMFGEVKEAQSDLPSYLS